jgi:hypothetical protein
MQIRLPKEKEVMTAQINNRVILAIMAIGCVCATGATAQVQYDTTAVTPTIITPPSGHSAFASGRAKGTQGYICLPTNVGASTASWTVKGARPEATLFQSLFGHDFQIITHFLSPVTNPNKIAPNPLPFGSATWQSSLDSSKVWAQLSQAIPAGSDASCPNAGSIACLLLEAIGTDTGPTGGTLLSNTTYVQRLYTNGGSAPTDGCTTSAEVGNQRLVPYTADYVFFRKDK